MWGPYIGFSATIVIIAVLYNLYANTYGGGGPPPPPPPSAPHTGGCRPPSPPPPPPPDAPNTGGSHSNRTKQPKRRKEAPYAGGSHSNRTKQPKRRKEALHADPEQDEGPVTRDEIAECANIATTRHYEKLVEVIRSCRRGNDVLIDHKLYENERVLFETRKMTKDWLDRQECSNFDKRRKLMAALDSAQSSEYSEDDEELFSAEVIKKRVSGLKSRRVAVAYDLLMTDIKPFAQALDVDMVEVGKLEEYKVQTTDPERHEKGTIGLVTLLLK